MSIGANINISAAIGGSSNASSFDLRASLLVGQRLTVRSFRGLEGISRCYRFDVVCLSDLEGMAFEPLVLGQAASLTLNGPTGSSRTIHGIVSSVKSEGLVSQRGYQYSIRIVPRLWQLKRRRNSRIYQDMTMSDIVGAVLNDMRVPFSFHLKSTYPKRPYCVQYQETDYAFVTRLLAEEGVFFYFEFPALADALLGSTGAALLDEAANVAGQIGGAVGSAASAVSGAVDITENVVFCDTSDLYPVISSENAVSSAVAGGLELAATFGAGGGAVSELGAVVTSALPAPAVPYNPADDMVVNEHVHSFGQRRTLRSKSVTLRDYDFRRPLLNLTARATVDPTAGVLSNGPASIAGAASAAISTGGVSLAATVSGAASNVVSGIDPRSFEVYEHHGEYEEPEVQARFAARYLEQLRSDARFGDGTSNCRRFVPGYRFLLVDHAQEELNREYALALVEHHGKSPEFGEVGEDRVTYENVFKCVPADVAYRPRRPKRRVQQVVESAVVVGPAGEEIYTDEFGRIKVQFHWDRLGQKNEHSSVWMRVAQPWAGASWGFQFIPRIGMEVLVTFLGGDEDRPVISGAVYNQTHPAPFPLPREKTRSGIRSQTSPGGGGSNEVSFEDAKGAEELLLRGERDLVERAGNDQLQHVGHDHRVIVGSDQHTQIEGNRSDAVGQHDSRAVGLDQTLNIGRDAFTRIGGRQSAAIDGTSITNVNGASVTNLGDDARTIWGYSSVSVGTEDTPTGYTVSVNGVEAHEASSDITIRSQTTIVLEVGKSSIVMTPDSIRVATTNLILNASESVTVLAKGPAVQMTDKIDVVANTINAYSKGGVIELNEDGVKLEGPTVSITTEPDSPPSITDSVPPPNTKPFKWTMLDSGKQPLANKTYALVTQGFRQRGTTDGSGKISLTIPKLAVRAEIDLWTETYPQGPRQHYSVDVSDLPPSSVPAGAQLRLKNLGYYQGKTTDTITPEFKQAICQFQHDNGLGETGELDGKTTAKLDEVHPT